MRRVIVIVLDSCGCGAAPDAGLYGDEGADTLGHTADAVGGLTLPTLEALGLGHILSMRGVRPVAQPRAAFGRLQERSVGKDTTTGHWELAGLITTEPFRTFPDGFPPELIEAFSERTGRPVIGNTAASGTEIIERLGPQQLATGAWIVYTSADSVFQVAAHEQTIPLAELYTACTIARELCDPWTIGRVIARPYVGQPGSFERTYNRHDYSMPPPAPTVLDLLQRCGKAVVGVGKIGDIFCGRGLTRSLRTSGNRDGMRQTAQQLRELDEGLIFVNLIDFDMLYGHRRDAQGFATALRELDAALPEVLDLVGDDDLLLLTADHGNDPTFRGTDHTREQVPLLAYGPPCAAGRNVGVRATFADLAATVAEALDAELPPVGRSFLAELEASPPAGEHTCES